MGDALQPGEYVRIDTDDLQTPYLPDVASRGVAFTSLPNDDAANTPTRTITWPGGTDWYDRQPLRVRIEDGPAPAPVVPAGAVVAADWNAGARLLTVFVPQAEIVTVRLSSFVDKDPVTGADDLRVMGIWNRLSAAAQLAQDGDARHGRAWMLTPPETLVLVHAVEKPLLAPVVDVTDTGMQRILGDTFCALAGSIDNHAKSTGRLDVDAVWNEQRDDIGKDLPDDGVDGRPLAPGLAHVGDFQLDSDEDDCKVGYNDVPRVATKPPVHQLRHEFGDTKHRRVRYHATATTRFREYFPPEIVEGRDENGERFILHGGPEKRAHRPELAPARAARRAVHRPDLHVGRGDAERIALPAVPRDHDRCAPARTRRRYRHRRGGDPHPAYVPADAARVAACASTYGEAGSRRATANSWASC